MSRRGTAATAGRGYRRDKRGRSAQKEFSLNGPAAQWIRKRIHMLRRPYDQDM